MFIRYGNLEEHLTTKNNGTVMWESSE